MFESGLKFRGLVEGNGYSCGFNLLQYCNWRVAFSNSRLLYHLGEAGVTLSNEQQVRFYLGEESRLALKVAEIDEELTRISTRAGISVDTLLDIARKDYPILANEALKLGFLDEVIANPVSEKPPEGYVF
jgi:ATP-dependent protease ClpP protease subunit